MWVHQLSALTPYQDKMLYNTISLEEYNRFKHYYLMDALKGKRYGQAFCERFNISNASPLYHFKSQELSERWIEENFLVKNEAEVC